MTTAAPDRHGALPAGHTTLRTVTATHNLLTGDSSRVDLTVKGEIPAQVRVSATPVQRTDVDGSPMLAAYDISLTDPDGQEWQPAYGHPVTVTITDPSFGNGRSLDIFHEGPEGREYVASVISVNNTVTFPAKHFSVYVVGNPDGRNRLVVMFYRAYNPYADPNSESYETPIAPEHQNITIPDTVFSLVRRGDTVDNGEILESLIYPPGPGYLHPGVRFFGWSGRPDYSAELEDRMTIDIVRDSVYRRLLDTADKFNDLDTLKFFSVRLRTHNVYYRSFYNPRVVVGIDDILYPRDSTNVRPYVIHENYVPEDIDDYFNGWKLVDGDGGHLPRPLADVRRSRKGCLLYRPEIPEVGSDHPADWRQAGGQQTRRPHPLWLHLRRMVRRLQLRSTLCVSGIFDQRHHYLCQVESQYKGQLYGDGLEAEFGARRLRPRALLFRFRLCGTKC